MSLHKTEMQHDLKALDSDVDNKNNLLDGVWLISPVLKFLVKLKHIGSGSNGCDSGFRQVLALPTEIPSPNLFSHELRFSLTGGCTGFG